MLHKHNISPNLHIIDQYLYRYVQMNSSITYNLNFDMDIGILSTFTKKRGSKIEKKNYPNRKLDVKR